MNIKDLAQTVILICSFLMIPVFGFSYFMYRQLGLDQCGVLDKAFSITSSVFGGVATLAAACIASRIHGEGRHKRSYLNDKKKALSIIELMTGDLNVVGKDYFNNLSTIRKLFYQLHMPHRPCQA